MHKFKKLLMISVLFSFIITLTSCFDDDNAYKVIINDDYNIRVIQSHEDYAKLEVDEYYYTEDVYSGHIEINITIPKEIDDMPIFHFGRDFTTVINPDMYYHDKSDFVRAYIPFAIIFDSYFEEGTSFKINFNIEANIYIGLDNEIKFYNNASSEYSEVLQTFPCEFNFTVAEDCENYYSKDSKLYNRSDDKEIIFENIIHVSPNLVA